MGTCPLLFLLQRGSWRNVSRSAAHNSRFASTGAWHDLAKLLPVLARKGIDAVAVEDATGMERPQQNIWTVAVSVSACGGCLWQHREVVNTSNAGSCLRHPAGDSISAHLTAHSKTTSWLLQLPRTHRACAQEHVHSSAEVGVLWTSAWSR